MATRKNLTQLPQTRDKIRTTMLINRLQDFVFGKCTMTPYQVGAHGLVLDESLPDLKSFKVEYKAA
jgi:hypothetical protein